MISVIIPVFNGEQHIHTMYSCFEKQNYKNFELIFVNDGSSDNSLQVLNDLKDKSDITINVISQKNSGVSVARNVGIKNANGDYICFCDIDDEVSDTYLSDMVTILQNNDVDLVFCKHKLIQVDGTDVTNQKSSDEVVIKDSLSCLNNYLYGSSAIGCWELMVRKETIKNNDLWFAEGYKYCEDLHMVLRLISCTENIAYLDKHLYIYKIQENSATAKFNDERLKGYELMKSLESFFEVHSPQFVSDYKKYGATRILWSITWQASTNYNSKEFRDFIRKYKVREEMKKLITFNSRKVSLSAFLFMISPSLFRYATKKYGKKYIH